ncbi:MAG: Type II secretion system protein E [Microgenomates group bacterium GW2011_GWC1_37_8]|nr:MAG: Type II secretion system protein E [Microgenomates group bacterium GW2011_GWC1_37_8]
MDESSNTSTQQVRTPNLEPFFNVGIPDPVKFIDVVVREAITLGASDIFFEPEKDELRVRVRIDGVLHELGHIGLEAYGQISSRIKVLASLDPTEKRKIQEGQISIDHEGASVNLRVEIVQTVNGELIVIRIHEKKTIIMQLAQLGFSKQAYDAFMKILKQKSGLVLVCGPTGCGKTTTLYSTIVKLNENRVFNVMTIEDPVEFLLEGANQMQVQKDISFTFAQGLKTILRLSPDIVLVGEIRDKETAEIAVESGLTGQLVLSTLHAEDAVGALFRILDLEIETYLLNSSLAGIVAQRLVRRICPSCKVSYAVSAEEAELFKKIVGRPPKALVKGQGCGECGFLGFKGRMGIFEVLQITPKVRGMLRDRANETELRDNLTKEGYTTLLKDGLEKAEAGFTTVSEVLRNSLRLA